MSVTVFEVEGGPFTAESRSLSFSQKSVNFHIFNYGQTSGLGYACYNIILNTHMIRTSELSTDSWFLISEFKFFEHSVLNR